MVVDVKSCDHTTVMYRVEKLRTLISKRLYACVCQTIPPRPSTGAPGLRNDCQQRRYGIFQPVSPLFALHTHCSVRASAISAEIALATDGSYLLFALSVRGSITLSSSHRSFFDLPSSFIDDFSTSKPRTRTECEPGPKHTAGATSPGMPSTVIEAFNCPGLPITSIVISRSCRLTVRLTRELLPTGRKMKVVSLPLYLMCPVVKSSATAWFDSARGVPHDWRKKLRPTTPNCASPSSWSNWKEIVVMSCVNQQESSCTPQPFCDERLHTALLSERTMSGPSFSVVQSMWEPRGVEREAEDERRREGSRRLKGLDRLDGSKYR
mmetsp:Transcript_8733/g.21568  ORF Transcript_8733/g.21568 Transcript_8733/m.21568 type:complete len:323 (+) Transcript_8733:284-1252(+)